MISPPGFFDALEAKVKEEQLAKKQEMAQNRETTPPPVSCLTLPSPLSEMEAKLYYADIDPEYVLVARTSNTPWEAPSGPEQDRKIKEFRPGVGNLNHPIREAWSNLAPKIIAILNSMSVRWRLLQVVRIAYEEEFTAQSAPVIIWITVTPKSLSGNDGLIAASRCQKLLEENDIEDFEVEICEKVLKFWGGFEVTEKMHAQDVRERSLMQSYLNEKLSSRKTHSYFADRPPKPSS